MSDNQINNSFVYVDNMCANDMKLTYALVQKDEKAWTFFLKQYKKMCLIIARQHNLVYVFDELFSDFIIKLSGDSEKTGILEKYDGSASLKTYLSAVFRHIIFDYYRNKQKKGDYVLSSAIDNFPDPKSNFQAQFDEPDSDCEQKEDCLLNAVKLLPKEEQNLIELYYYNEFSLRQIGKTFGWSKSKVARHL